MKTSALTTVFAKLFVVIEFSDKFELNENVYSFQVLFFLICS